MRTTIIVAPAGRGVGITTACLGIVRALARGGQQQLVELGRCVDRADLFACSTTPTPLCP